MQILAQEFLPLAEKAKAIAFVDLEATGLKGDYNSILVVTVKPYQEKPISFVVDKPGDDRNVVREARDLMHQYPLWVTYYGKYFDIPMIQTRLLNWGFKETLRKHHHIDMYWKLRDRLLTARRSQAHLLRWTKTEEKKMDLSPDEWNNVLRNPKQGLKTMVARCESDTAGLEALYEKTKHLILEITR